MGWSKKAKTRVSWAPDVNLCEVKPFMRTDCPSRIAKMPSFYGPSPSFLLFASSFAVYDKINADIWKGMKSRMLQSDDIESPEMPPGFENQNVGRLKWKCPPKFNMCHKWQVAAGEESEEVEAQKLRDMRDPGAIYQHSSAIPLNPSVYPDIEDEHYDDRLTPVVPVENSEAVDESVLAPASETPSVGMLPGAAAAADVIVAALTAILKNKEQRTLTDIDLLAKILSNPNIVQKLTDAVDGASCRNETALANMVTAPMVAAKPVTEPVSISNLPEIYDSINDQARPVAKNDVTSAAATSPMLVAKSVAGLSRIVPMPADRNLSIPNHAPVPTQPNSNTKMQPTLRSMPAQPGPFPVSSGAAMTANPITTKGANYYRKLIEEYGGKRQKMPNSLILEPDSKQNQSQNMIQVQDLKPVDLQTKSRKPCKYFRRSKGCRNGSKCPYKHDMLPKLRAGGTLESPIVKKMKLMESR